MLYLDTSKRDYDSRVKYTYQIPLICLLLLVLVLCLMIQYLVPLKVVPWKVVPSKEVINYCFEFLMFTDA